MPSPELYVRWVQFAVFSPAFRPHCTRNVDNDRRIWAFPLDAFDVMQRAMQFRSQLVPYIYNASRAAFDTGVSLVRPLYYDFADYPQAYSDEFGATEYMFGDQLLVAPIASSIDNATGVASRAVWFPPAGDAGGWIDLFGGRLFAGNQTTTRTAALFEMPVFVRAGGILPLLPPQPTVRPLFGAAQLVPDRLCVNVYLSAAVASFATVLYDDDGNSTQYQRGPSAASAPPSTFAYTPISYRLSADLTSVVVRIGPLWGSFVGLPPQRQYQLRLPNTWPAAKVTVGGAAAPFVPPSGADGELFLAAAAAAGATLPAWQYDGATLCTSVFTPPWPVANVLDVVVQFAAPLDDSVLLAGVVGQMQRAFATKQYLDNQFPDIFGVANAKPASRAPSRRPRLVPGVFQEEFENVIVVAGTPERLNGRPDTAVAELHGFCALQSAALNDIRTLNATADVIQYAEGLFGAIDC